MVSPVYLVVNLVDCGHKRRVSFELARQCFWLLGATTLTLLQPLGLCLTAFSLVSLRSLLAAFCGKVSASNIFRRISMSSDDGKHLRECDWLIIRQRVQELLVADALPACVDQGVNSAGFNLQHRFCKPLHIIFNILVFPLLYGVEMELILPP